MVQGGFHGATKAGHCQKLPNNGKREGSVGQGVNPGRAGFQTFRIKEGELPSRAQFVKPLAAGMSDGANLQPSGGLVKSLHSAVKLEVDDSSDAVCPASCKRPKLMAPSPQEQQQLSPETSTAASECLFFNPLEEPSPLGLTLRKTPSFLDLIQMKLSQGDLAFSGALNDLSHETGRKKESKCASALASADKLKASNFSASFLRIGSWERISRYEGDLVAKCYYAKRKLVWEVLEGGLKSKIEIQWSDITFLNASCSENEPGTLQIELSRPPLFFRETNPQPRKHTLWQATSDFTGEQASLCRKHYLQFPQGVLERHYEKLLLCDHRLNMLSKKGVVSKDSQYFDSASSVFPDQDEQSCYRTEDEYKDHLLPQFEHLKDAYLSPFSSSPDMKTSTCLTLVPKLEPKHESLDFEGRILEAAAQQTPSPSSVMDAGAIEDSGASDSDELHMKGAVQWKQLRHSSQSSGLWNQGSDLLLSKSMSTLVNQIGSCFSEPKFSCNSLPIGEGTQSSNRKILDDIAQHLLSDSLAPVTSDEQKIIARVNSMCSLLQKDTSMVHASQINTEIFESTAKGYGLGKFIGAEDGSEVCEGENDMKAAGLRRGDQMSCHNHQGDGGDMYCKQASGMTRQESSGDLLLNLPRIASFPQFIINSADDLVLRSEQPGTVGWNQFR